jgi:hypothetical protein
VQKGILKPFPQAPLDLFVIWISMMEGDDSEAARKAVSKFKDERVNQFYDPNQLAGKAFAGSLDHIDEIAWDIYLFYPAKSVWKELPPQPEMYMHQLRDSWADQGCLFEKDRLRVKLTETMKNLFP